MATELGQAYVQIMPSAKGIKGSIEKELSGETSSAGKAAGGKIVTAIKGAITVAAIGKFIGSSLTEGGGLQQSLGGVETLFKENADKVKQYANEAYKTAGLSANSYMENVTSFSASLLQSVGGDTEKAAEKANTAMIDMSDNANKMGTDMGDIQNAYQGFAKQNYTMLDNLKLGYGGTKSEMERLLADATKLSGVEYNIDNLSDVYDAIHVVQEELGITGTTALESAETLTGSLASMKSAFSNFLGNLSLGQDVTPSLKALAETVSTFLFGNFLPMVGNILKSLPSAIVTFIKEATPYFLEAGGNLINQISTGLTEGLPRFIENVESIVSNFIELISNNLPKILTVGKDLLISLINGIVAVLPDLITTAITLIAKFVAMLISKLPDIIKAGIEILGAIISGIGQVASKLYDKGAELMQELSNKIQEKFSDLKNRGSEIVASIINGISIKMQDAKNAITKVIQSIRDVVDSWKDKFKNAGSNIVSSIADGITGAVRKVKDAISNVVGAVRDYLPFSPAKEGPLKDLNKLNFGGTISDSIYNARGAVTSAMSSLAQDAMDSYNIGSPFDGAMNEFKTGALTYGLSQKVGGLANSQSIGEAGQDGDVTVKLVVQLDGDTVAEKVVSNIKRKSRINNKEVTEV